MYKILFIILLIVMFFTLYEICRILFNVENKKNVKAFKSSRIKKRIVPNPKYMFAKYIKISNFKREEMANNLYSLNWDITPEEYISKNLFDFILLFPLIVVFFIAKIYFFAVWFLIMDILIFVRNQGKINRHLVIRRNNIEEEAPTLIRYFMVTLKNNKDIKQIFENYLELAGYMRRDIELTLIDMSSTMNREDNLIRSLENLDDRLNTPIMNDFITGLINVTRGKNQESYFFLLERELKELSIHTLNLKSKKIEKLIKKYFWILVIMFIIISITEFVLFIKTSISF